MDTNIKYNFRLKEEILSKLKNESLLLLVSIDTGVKYSTLKRQVNSNHKLLTLYEVLKSISQRLEMPIHSLVIMC